MLTRWIEHVRGGMGDDERAEMEESTRGGTSPDGCGGMVGWDCQLEIGTETGFGSEGLVASGCAACRW